MCFALLKPTAGVVRLNTKTILVLRYSCKFDAGSFVSVWEGHSHAEITLGSALQSYRA